jgi:hypothetical protein
MLTLASGWSAMASRWTGQSIREGNMATSSVKPSTPGAAYGKGAMLSRGYFAYVSGKAGSRVTVRMMRTPTHEAEDRDIRNRAISCGLATGSAASRCKGTAPSAVKSKSSASAHRINRRSHTQAGPRWPRPPQGTGPSRSRRPVICIPIGNPVPASSSAGTHAECSPRGFAGATGSDATIKAIPDH